MTNKKFIVLIFFMSFIVFLGSSFLTSSYKEATLLGIKWTTTNANGAVVKVRNANLPASYANDFAAGYNQWTNSSARVNVSSTTSVGKGIISFQAQNQSTWSQNGWGTGEAWAQPMNTDTAVYCSANPTQDPSLKCSKVTDGVVWINSSNVSSSSARRQGVIAHEIGHMIGLAHTTNTISASIMCSSLACYGTTQYKVQAYDISEVNSLY